MSKPVILRFPEPVAGRRRRIAFVINSLGAGGAERVMANILHSASEAEWDVHLILLDREEERRAAPAFATMHRLDCRMKLLPSISELQRVLGMIAPDVVVSFLVRANVASVIASRRLGIPVVISERSHLTTHLAGRYRGLKRWAAGLAPKLVYRRANLAIACSEGVRSDLIASFGMKPAQVETIHNPFDLDAIDRAARQQAEIALPSRFMVSVGRLVEAKGFADLIEAYALAKPDIPLCILGDGPDRSLLEGRVAELGLQDRIFLPGYAKNPFAILARAEFYVSASHCEGFPNALAEAMAVGLPSISTDCPSGPAEILAEMETTGATEMLRAQYGVLVPVQDCEAMARALSLMADADVRAQYARKALRRMQDYRIETIAGRYWSAFRRVLDGPADVTTRRQPWAAGRAKA